MSTPKNHSSNFDWAVVNKQVMEIMEGVALHVRLKNVKTHALREPLWRIQTKWEGGIMEKLPDIKAQDAEVTPLGLVVRWFTAGPAFLEYKDAVTYIHNKYICKGYKRGKDYFEHKPKPYAKQ